MTTNEIPAALTDENLQAEAFFKGEVARLLLMAPAEHRQAILAERARRSSTLRRVGREHVIVATGSSLDALRAILAERGWLRS